MTAIKTDHDVISVQDFAGKVRTWLASNAGRSSTWPVDEDGMVAFSQRFAQDRFDAGLAGINWPKEYGGQGLSVAHERAYAEEAAKVATPVLIFGIGVNMVGPTLLIAGSDEQRARFIPPLLAGAELWCQLFSEPSAGSDLASLRTSAVPVDGGWQVTGQKIWTTNAHHADFGLLLARTDPTAAKHAGLTMFLVPMRQPGVEVRRIKDMSGAQRFNEVFLDDAFIPDENRVGAVGDGWRVAGSTLSVERVAVGNTAANQESAVSSTGLMGLARTNGSIGSAEVRDALVSLHVHETLLGLLGIRLAQEAAVGRPAGPRGSGGKVVKGDVSNEAARVARLVMGSALLAWTPGDRTAEVVEGLCAAPGVMIAGGTGEIQRNIIAERVLGLPR